MSEIRTRAPCTCCGKEYDEVDLTALMGHADIQLCRGCIGWLAGRRFQRAGEPGLREVVPVLLTTDLPAAIARYEQLGFDVETYDDGYGFLERDGASMQIGVVETLDPTASNWACYLYVHDADALYAEWEAAGVDGTLTAPEAKPWHMYEGSYVDPDGNLIRFGADSG